MENTASSDLEEGEILEYEFCSPKYFLNDDVSGSVSSSVEVLKKNYVTKHHEFKEERIGNGYFPHFIKEDYRGSSGIVKVKDARDKRIDNEKAYKLDYISSSEGEYSSDLEENHVKRHVNCYTSPEVIEDKLKRKHCSQVLHGTAEDIMSQIDQTICRKSHCSYKRRKSRDFKYTFDKMCRFNSCSVDIKTGDMLSSRAKSKRKLKQNLSCNSDVEICETYREDQSRRKRCGSRKKRKKVVYYCTREMLEDGYEDTKRPSVKKVRDFDEVRKSLLEKLKKQKAEKESQNKFSLGSEEPKLENSEIQEVEMLTDSTNYVDNPSNVTHDSSSQVQLNEEPCKSEKNENEGDDEMDVVKLRLIALASNKKRSKEAVVGVLKSDKSVDGREVGENAIDRMEDDGTDLDRNELLLRAEALKTALLKKHQKRLNRLKCDRSNVKSSSSDNDGCRSVPSELFQNNANKDEKDGKNSENAERISVNDFNSKLDQDAYKENVNREIDGEANSESLVVLNELCETQSDRNEAPVTSDVKLKRLPRIRNKKRKRRSCSMPSNVKENNEKSDAVEDDVRILRRQLLCDLIKKKSLKDSEKKSVLIETTQTSDNKPHATGNTLPSDENTKSTSVFKNTVLKTASKGTRTVTPPVIPKPEIQRIIVHLGSEDSSDDEVVPMTKRNCNENERNVTKVNSTAIRNPADESIQACYEKSVELLLSQARKKIEGEMEKTRHFAAATPEAVYKHLPPSQRLEYIRLKQKIAEREKLKKMRNENPGSPSESSNQTQTIKSTSVTGNDKGTPEKFESVLQSVSKVDTEPGSTKTTNFEEKNTEKHMPESLRSGGESLGTKFSNLNKIALKGKVLSVAKINAMSNNVTNNKFGMKRSLSKYVTSHNGAKDTPARSLVRIPPTQAFISKLKILLKKIKIEKTIEENYEKEIVKLKNQLNLFEKKKNEQRFKIKKLAEESTKIYKMMQNINPQKESKESKEKEEKMIEECKSEEGLGQGNLEGSKVEDKPKSEIIENRTTAEVTTTNECRKDEPARLSIINELPDYNSPLEVFNKGSGSSDRVNPDVIMCQFDLMGVCKDEECTYQHLRGPKGNS